MADPKPIITLDGPAGAGKSTVARLLAARLAYRCLDTGAMYRVAAWKARRLGLDDPAEIAAMIRGTRIGLGDGRVTCDGEDVTDAVRDPSVTVAAGPIAASPACREELVRKQREWGRGGGVVTEGRDQGTVVFPDAEHKFYLDASLDVRAERRWREEGGDAGAVREAMARRDEADRTRPVGPLVRPEGARRIDTSALTVEEVVTRILAALGSS